MRKEWKAFKWVGKKPTKADLLLFKCRKKKLAKNEKKYTIEKLARMTVNQINKLNFQEDLSLGYLIKQICMEIDEIKRGIR